MLPRQIGGEQMAASQVEAELATMSQPLPNEVRALWVVKQPVRGVFDLERSKAQLKVAQRVFRNWIILHRPIAALMYVLSFVHVALAYMFTPSLGG